MRGSIADVLAGRARWCVARGDAVEVLSMLPDDSIGATLTDPPYSADLYARTRTNKGSGLRPNGSPVAASEFRESRSAFQLASDAIGAIDGILEPAAAEIQRVTRRWMVVFHDCETEGWRKSFGQNYVRTCAWVKPDPMPQVSGDRPGQGFELATVGHRRPGRMRWNGGGHAGVWFHGVEKGHGRLAHPCPKPIDLMVELVSLFTDPDELVIDPFAGSSTTGAACLRLGRRFLGVERNEEFHRLSVDRLTAESRGQSFREFKAGQLSLLADGVTR